MNKQRRLTDIQLTVLNMKLAKRTNAEIACVIGVHPATVSCKWRDIQKGIKKGAYNNLPGDFPATKDLFN